MSEPVVLTELEKWQLVALHEKRLRIAHEAQAAVTAADTQLQGVVNQTLVAHGISPDPDVAYHMDFEAGTLTPQSK